MKARTYRRHVNAKPRHIRRRTAKALAFLRRVQDRVIASLASEMTVSIMSNAERWDSPQVARGGLEELLPKAAVWVPNRCQVFR